MKYHYARQLRRNAHFKLQHFKDSVNNRDFGASFYLIIAQIVGSLEIPRCTEMCIIDIWNLRNNVQISTQNHEIN